jgi:hypothetical protein
VTSANARPASSYAPSSLGCSGGSPRSAETAAVCSTPRSALFRPGLASQDRLRDSVSALVVYGRDSEGAVLNLVTSCHFVAAFFSSPGAFAGMSAVLSVVAQVPRSSGGIVPAVDASLPVPAEVAVPAVGVPDPPHAEALNATKPARMHTKAR